MQKATIVIVLLAAIGFTSCRDFGKKTTKGHIETYYKDGITEVQAQKTADLMYYIDSVANNAKGQKSFQLCKKNDTVCFRMVVNVEKANNLGDFSFLAIANMVSDSVFNGAPVNMDLTNNTFKSVKLIPYKKLDLNDIEKSDH